MIITIHWFGISNTHAEVWRLLDLSGMTKSVRESRNFTKAGYVHVNGSRVYSLKETQAIGNTFTLELRFPNGKIVSRDIYLAHRLPRARARQNSPTTVYRKP